MLRYKYKQNKNEYGIKIVLNTKIYTQIRCIIVTVILTFKTIY